LGRKPDHGIQQFLNSFFRNKRTCSRNSYSRWYFCSQNKRM